MNAHPNKLDQTWGLELGIVNAELLDASIYLPNNLAPQFRDWLLSGVKAGHAGASGMLFHGSPVKDAPKETKSYELYLDIAGLTLEYHPDWPQLDDVTAVVYAGIIVVWAMLHPDAGGLRKRAAKRHRWRPPRRPSAK